MNVFEVLTDSPRVKDLLAPFKDLGPSFKTARQLEGDIVYFVEPLSEVPFFTPQRRALGHERVFFVTATSHGLGSYFTNHRQRAPPTPSTPRPTLSKITHPLLSVIERCISSLSLDKIPGLPPKTLLPGGGTRYLKQAAPHISSQSSLHLMFIFRSYPIIADMKGEPVAPGIITGTRVGLMRSGVRPAGLSGRPGKNHPSH